MRPTCDICGLRYRDFCDFVKCELRRQKISQEKLAKMLGLPRQGIVDRLSGATDWKFKEVLDVLYILEVEEPSEIFRVYKVKEVTP